MLMFTALFGIGRLTVLMIANVESSSRVLDAENMVRKVVRVSQTLSVEASGRVQNAEDMVRKVVSSPVDGHGGRGLSVEIPVRFHDAENMVRKVTSAAVEDRHSLGERHNFQHNRMKKHDRHAADADRNGFSKEANPLGCVKGTPKGGWGMDAVTTGGQLSEEAYKFLFEQRAPPQALVGKPPATMPSRCEGTPTTLTDERHPLEALMPGLLEGKSCSSADAGCQLRSHMDKQLDGLELGKPIVMTVIEVQHKAKAMQFRNFVCALDRLNITSRVVVFALDQAAADLVHELSPSIRVVNHPDFLSLAKACMNTGILYPNRLAKLVGAALLLERGHEVLVSDTDTFWRLDPSEELQRLGSDMVAMRDGCMDYEVNTGFLYYKPSPKVRNMLRIAFSIRKLPTLITDNDQYLLNCAIAASGAHGGLRPHLLPRRKYWFGRLCKSYLETAMSEEELVVFHASGASVFGVIEELMRDRKIADVDEAGVCYQGARVSLAQTQFADPAC
jgi:hypothetical protein